MIPWTHTRTQPYIRVGMCAEDATCTAKAGIACPAEADVCFNNVGQTILTQGQPGSDWQIGLTQCVKVLPLYMYSCLAGGKAPLHGRRSPLAHAHAYVLHVYLELLTNWIASLEPPHAVGREHCLLRCRTASVRMLQLVSQMDISDTTCSDASIQFMYFLS